VAACPDENVLVDLLQGRLLPDAAVPLQRHIDACAACFRLVAELSSLEASAPPPEDSALRRTELNIHSGQAAAAGPPTDVIPAVGARIGRYRLERRLGLGGLGEVFLATQEGPAGYAKPCVVKRMLPQYSEQSEVVELFLNEARVAAGLSHPHIAQVHDFGDAEGTLFMAMEFVDGPTLAQVIRAHAERSQFIPLACAARLVSQVASALDFVHRASSEDGAGLGIVHRDVSTSNIMLSRDGVAKLIDFGLAKTRVSEKTHTGVIRGNVTYMSPEHARGQPLTAQSDIYELGLVFYELLTNVRAIDAHNHVDAIHAAVEMRFAPVEKHRPDLPAEVVNAVHRCLAPAPADRYPRAADLSEELERFLVARGEVVSSERLAHLCDPQTSTPAGTATPSPGERFRRWRWALPAAAVLVGLGAFGLWTRRAPAPVAQVNPAPRAEPEPEPQPAPPPPEPAATLPAKAAVSATGELWVQSSPRLEVYIDGRKYGATPVRAELAPGVHTLLWKGEHPGLSRSRTVQVRAGKTSTERWTPHRGTLSFRVIPYAQVFVDAKPVGLTPIDPVPVWEGRHSVRFLNPENHRSETREVEVFPDKDVLIGLDLR
jgi:serine/threonine protein kinase